MRENDPTYDYVDVSTVRYEAAGGGNLVYSGRKREKHQESVLYHSVGPRTIQTTHKVSDTDLYDDPTVHLLDPTYEDPNLTQVTIG